MTRSSSTRTSSATWKRTGWTAWRRPGRGRREIALAVLATSLSLVVIFVPIAFMGGIVGRFFSSFGLTVAFAVMMSLFVSFTLTPMLCSRFLKLEPVAPGERHGHHQAKSKSGFIYRMIDGSYGLVLRGAMRHKFLVVMLTVGVIATTVPIGKIMGVSLIPRDDQSEYEVTVTTPEGYSLERTSKLLTELENRIWKTHGARNTSSRPSARPRAAAWSRARATSPGRRSMCGSPTWRNESRRRARGLVGPPRPRPSILEGPEVRPVRRPAGGAAVPGGLPRPARQRQRRLAVPGRPTAADLPGQPRGSRPEYARRICEPTGRAS